MSDILLDVQHLTHCFPLPGRQTLRAVDDVSFQLKQGEILGLVGESGCGKSTVARCIMNVYRPCLLYTSRPGSWASPRWR